MTRTIPEKVQQLIRRIDNNQVLTPHLAQKYLAQSDLQAEDLLAWADFEHPKADSYGRLLVHDGGFFELMVMSWVDGDMAAIHDHGHTQWGAVKLLGPAEHATFKLIDGKMTTMSREVCGPGTVLAVDHPLIHQMGNIGNVPYLTLHLYGAYDVEGGVTADARLYDLDEGKIQFTSGGVFFDLPESDINRRESGPQADFPTTLRYKTELSNPLFAKNDSVAKGRFSCDREQKIANEILDGETWEQLCHDIERLGDKSRQEVARYGRILDQELFMTANLQMKILQAGMVKNSCSTLKANLAGLLKNRSGQRFSSKYLRIIENDLGSHAPLQEVYRRNLVH